MAHDVIVEITRAGNRIFKAKIGLLPETYWQSDLRDYSIKSLRTIRKSLEKSIPRLTEKFNPTTPSLRYFGYRIRKSKSLSDISKKAYSEDKAYIRLNRSLNKTKTPMYTSNPTPASMIRWYQ